MEYAQIADYLLRPANPDDQAQIYHLKAQSVRPYVETSETDTHFILEYPHDFTKKKTMITE